MVTRPRRATGTSRTTPIGSPHRGLGVRRPHWTSGLPTPELSTRTFWTFAREFSSLRRHGSATRGATLSPDTVRPVYSCDRAVRCSRQSSPDARARRSPGSERSACTCRRPTRTSWTLPTTRAGGSGRSSICGGARSTRRVGWCGCHPSARRRGSGACCRSRGRFAQCWHVAGPTGGGWIPWSFAATR